MRAIGVVLVLLFVVLPVGAVRIRQVVVHPFEVVQLENPSDEFALLDGLVLATEVSDRDVLLRGTIPPHGFFLVGESDAPVPVGLVDTITLYNVDSGIALMNGSEILDAVSWGNVSGIPSKFIIGSPTVNPGVESLLRNSSVGDTSLDFVLTPPSLSGNVARVEIVGAPSSTINSVFVSDASSRSGVQIVLRPGNVSFVSVNVSGEGLVDGSVELAGISGSLASCPGSNSSLCGGVLLPFTIIPETYNLVVRVGGEERVVSVSVLPLLSLRVDKFLMSVDDVLAASRGDMSVLPQVVNDGNVVLRVELSRVGSRSVVVGRVFPGESLPVDVGSIPGEVFIVGVPE